MAINGLLLKYHTGLFRSQLVRCCASSAPPVPDHYQPMAHTLGRSVTMFGRIARPDTLRCMVLIDPLVQLVTLHVWSNNIDAKDVHNI